jgi:hypothetical protein
MRLASSVLIAAWCTTAMAATVPVRYVEGLTRGHLELRNLDGKLLAHGDLVQIVRGDEVDKRMVFRFLDGSLYDERVVFTEEEVFRLKSFRLTERGPSFAADAEYELTPATGAYRVKRKDRKDGKEKVDEGKIELPADVYNGMIITIVKDVPKGQSMRVSMVAFAPDPRVVELEFTPIGERAITVGDLEQKAVEYRLKFHLGFWMKLFAKILDRMPPDLHVWVATEEAPSFVAFQGPITSEGPIWRIELVSPRLAPR